jgi:hypothetical protein
MTLLLNSCTAGVKQEPYSDASANSHSGRCGCWNETDALQIQIVSREIVLTEKSVQSQWLTPQLQPTFTDKTLSFVFLSFA